eukprot:COSAG03_NODE_5329_length_1273_cov_2.456559_1_plen_341_part_01
MRTEMAEHGREQEGDGGPPLTQREEAGRLAKEWYDQAGPLAGELVLGAWSAAHLNYADGWDAEWSLRYTVQRNASGALPQEAVAPLLLEQYFVRFFYEYDEGKWSCYGLDEHKASTDADTGVELDVRLWAKLVLRCAKALRRASSNLPSYVAEASIQLQLGALGAAAMRQILTLSVKEGALDEQEKQYVLKTLDTAMRCPTLEGKNGAKAALNVVKWLGGGGQVAGGRQRREERPSKKLTAEADGHASPAKRRRPSGEMRRVYLQSADGPAAKLGGVESIMLRREPVDRSDDAVWLESGATVSNGDLVQMVGQPATERDTETKRETQRQTETGEFVLIRTD